MNIGFKPTFHKDNKEPSFEVHLLDETFNLYGKEIEVEFIAYIRSEKKFEGVAQLIDQIKIDCSSARLQLTEWKIK
jgi:riboflavin kinase/FMN adenylyltransferase